MADLSSETECGAGLEHEAAAGKEQAWPCTRVVKTNLDVCGFERLTGRRPWKGAKAEQKGLGRLRRLCHLRRCCWRCCLPTTLTPSELTV